VPAHHDAAPKDRVGRIEGRDLSTLGRREEPRKERLALRVELAAERFQWSAASRSCLSTVRAPFSPPRETSIMISA
jgi:hypothetical protein